MESHAGKLLVATPLLVDPNFYRSVILLIEHDQENGALGVVLNRPTPVPVDEILAAWHDVAAEPRVVFVGGPVQREVAVGLGVTEGADQRRVIGAVSMVDLGSTPQEEGDAKDVRVFSGYAGWDVTQLEDEIEEGAWFVLPALPHDPLTEHPERLWQAVLARQKARVALYATYPDDPDEN